MTSNTLKPSCPHRGSTRKCRQGREGSRALDRPRSPAGRRLGRKGESGGSRFLKSSAVFSPSLPASFKRSCAVCFHWRLAGFVLGQIRGGFACREAAASSHRVSLVLCVDAFRCLQLSPCRGTARLGRSSKPHGMKWRLLEARRKVQY